MTALKSDLQDGFDALRADRLHQEAAGVANHGWSV